MATATYGRRFFAGIRPGARSSAEALAPFLLHKLGPVDSVIDVGCGEGHWGAEFERCGVRRVVGLDRLPPGVDPLIELVETDLAVEAGEVRKASLGCFDLALSLEVAEHLPPERAEGFVAELCSYAPIVVFSAAVPGQGGDGHLNEQWPDYWAQLFAAQGYAGSGWLRWKIWNDERVKWWYRQNLLVFSDPKWARFFDTDDGCPAVIHPEAWRHHGAFQGVANL